MGRRDLEQPASQHQNIDEAHRGVKRLQITALGHLHRATVDRLCRCQLRAWHLTIIHTLAAAFHHSLHMLGEADFLHKVLVQAPEVQDLISHLLVLRQAQWYLLVVPNLMPILRIHLRQCLAPELIMASSLLVHHMACLANLHHQASPAMN